MSVSRLRAQIHGKARVMQIACDAAVEAQFQPGKINAAADIAGDFAPHADADHIAFNASGDDQVLTKGKERALNDHIGRHGAFFALAQAARQGCAGG